MTFDDVKAILRDYEMHSPGCSKRQIEKAQRDTGAYLYPQECNCWLSEKDDDDR
jgi:hypothetical protein